MAISDYIREFTPGRVYREGDPATMYWIRGDKILYLHYPLKDADIDSFRFYFGRFGKDRKHCYCASTRLAGGNGASFRALNNTFATDGKFVWTMGGKIKDADADSFVVCDDGIYDVGGGSLAPYGFGKDKNRVFYYDFDGKPNWVRKASPASFFSLNDGHFGKDDKFVFCGPATLPKANVEYWKKIRGFYSKDDARIYYFNRPIRDADYGSFEVLSTGGNFIQLAKDRTHFYNNDCVIDESEFEVMVKKYCDEGRTCG
jgi:hypothetical protein